MITIDLKGAEQFIAKSRKARGLFTRTVVRSLRKSLRKPVSDRRRSTRGVPMIRAMLRTPWGKGDRGKLSSRVKFFMTVKGNTVVAGVGMYGYAAAVRTGDRIPPHKIPLKTFQARKKGQRGRSRRDFITHPGARLIPQISGARSASLSAEAPEILRQLERDVHEMLERVYGL